MDLSVIISVCGEGRHIAACLRSVTRCSRENIDMECIVTNKDSADEISAVVNRYIERDNRIKLIISENGSSDMRNTGVEKASGRYILFLDADDRLCEDAWEQLEAAVEEEYADFVAFSYITSRKNGKLKAKMLPLSDGISTDEGEARRLMYADSVLKSCRGKLFKSQIIRDNNIFFPEKFPDEADLFFVTWYFEHCESYLLTKAMILYSPRENGIVMSAKDGSMEEYLDRIRIMHTYSLQTVRRYNDRKLMRCVQLYFFRLQISLLCEYVREYSYRKKVFEEIFEKALGHRYMKELLDEVDERWFCSKIQRYEYRLLREGNAAKVRKYVFVKAKMRDTQDIGLKSEGSYHRN